MFGITSAFEGGNIKVMSQTDHSALLSVDLRDTAEDWFYWCFKVEGAVGKTVEFVFESKHRVGYFGAAVSYDRQNWHWQHDVPEYNGDRFVYTFAEGENEVYFAHHIIYPTERFDRLARKHGLEAKCLCISERGREVPYIDTEIGSNAVFITAGHHACESTGSYVLEGLLDQLLLNSSRFDCRIICVPFVDYDGVLDGDQGKGRAPHDHNRDYDGEIPPIYAATGAIRSIFEKHSVRYALDLHSPWHLGGENDRLFLCIKDSSDPLRTIRFSRLFESYNSDCALPHYAKDDRLPDTGWNRSSTPTFTNMGVKFGAELSFSVETPYFIAGGIPFSADRAIASGRNLARALLKYHGEKGRNIL